MRSQNPLLILLPLSLPLFHQFRFHFTVTFVKLFEPLSHQPYNSHSVTALNKYTHDQFTGLSTMTNIIISALISCIMFLDSLVSLWCFPENGTQTCRLTTKTRVVFHYDNNIQQSCSTNYHLPRGCANTIYLLHM